MMEYFESEALPDPIGSHACKDANFGLGTMHTLSCASILGIGRRMLRKGLGEQHPKL